MTNQNRICWRSQLESEAEAIRIMGLLARTHPRRGWEFVEFRSNAGQ